MKAIATVLTVSVILAATSAATAHTRKAPRFVVTPAAKVDPEVARLIGSGVHPEVARMIVSSRPGIIPNYIHYERVQAMDTLTGVPPMLSGASLANPWINYQQYERGTGRRLR